MALFGSGEQFAWVVRYKPERGSSLVCGLRLKRPANQLGNQRSQAATQSQANARLIANEPPIGMFDNVRDGVYREVIRGWERRSVLAKVVVSKCAIPYRRNPLGPLSFARQQLC
jgi:hypothetical protein